MCPWLPFRATQIRALLRVPKGFTQVGFHTLPCSTHTRPYLSELQRSGLEYLLWVTCIISNIFRLDKDTGKNCHTYSLKTGFSISRRGITIDSVGKIVYLYIPAKEVHFRVYAKPIFQSAATWNCQAIQFIQLFAAIPFTVLLLNILKR